MVRVGTRSGGVHQPSPISLLMSHAIANVKKRFKAEHAKAEHARKCARRAEHADAQQQRKAKEHQKWVSYNDAVIKKLLEMGQCGVRIKMGPFSMTRDDRKPLEQKRELMRSTCWVFCKACEAKGCNAWHNPHEFLSPEELANGQRHQPRCEIVVGQASQPVTFRESQVLPRLGFSMRNVPLVAVKCQESPPCHLGHTPPPVRCFTPPVQGLLCASLRESTLPPWTKKTSKKANLCHVRAEKTPKVWCRDARCTCALSGDDATEDAYHVGDKPLVEHLDRFVQRARTAQVAEVPGVQANARKWATRWIKIISEEADKESEAMRNLMSSNAPASRKLFGNEVSLSAYSVTVTRRANPGLGQLAWRRSPCHAPPQGAVCPSSSVAVCRSCRDGALPL